MKGKMKPKMKAKGKKMAAKTDKMPGGGKGSLMKRLEGKEM